MNAKYLRKLDDPFVYVATPFLIKRGDMYPCDKDGNFVSSGMKEMAEAEPEPPAKEVVPKEDTEANEKRIKLLDRAKDLGIGWAHTMKEETLLMRIGEAERLLASKKADPETEDEDKSE